MQAPVDLSPAPNRPRPDAQDSWPLAHRESVC